MRSSWMEPAVIVKQGPLQILQRSVGVVRQCDAGGDTPVAHSTLVWKRAWFVLERKGALFQLQMRRSLDSASALAAFSLVGAQLGSLPGDGLGLVLRIADSGRQLRLKSQGLSDYAAWICALQTVPDMRDANTFAPHELSGAPEAREHTARANALAEGLASLSGAMRLAVEPVATAAKEMASAQVQLHDSVHLPCMCDMTHLTCMCSAQVQLLCLNGQHK